MKNYTQHNYKKVLPVTAPGYSAPPQLTTYDFNHIIKNTELAFSLSNCDKSVIFPRHY